MPVELDRDSHASETPRRLKLLMPQSSQSPPPTRAIIPEQSESAGSPARPSYSPVTPTLAQPALAFPQPQTDAEPRDLWMTEPEALPVSLDDNSDAIALRAAISILQMQRQQSIKDIKDLERIRKAAVEEPEGFVDDLNTGKLTSKLRDGINVDAEESESESGQQDVSEESRFGTIPAAQNVVRAPPIEWSKYHIVGEPLDRMHEIQRRYPGFREEMLDAVQKPQPHSVASPYKPFADKLDDPPTPPQRKEYGN
jgi:hypothetical protein